MQGFLLPRVVTPRGHLVSQILNLTRKPSALPRLPMVEGGHEGSEYMRQELMTVSNFLSLVTMLDLMQSMFHLLPY